MLNVLIVSRRRSGLEDVKEGEGKEFENKSPSRSFKKEIDA